MEIILDLKNYDKADTVFKRTAARAIIKREKEYLFIHSKYGDYKFPGGGVEKGESLEEAMIREVQEETGFQVKKETISFYGKVLERRKGHPEDIIEMDSHYFFCEVEKDNVDRKLDEYEEEYDYQIIWLPLREAIIKNKQMANFDVCPWVIRETKVMEKLLVEQYLSEIPENMKKQVQRKSYVIDSAGCSGAHIILFDNNLVLKVEPKGNESDGEYHMMMWLQGRLPVPEVKGFYSDGKTNYLLMSKLKGNMACDSVIIKDTEKMVKLLAKGLKLLWQADINDCPRVINLDYKLEYALYRVNNNLIDLEDAEPETFGTDGFANPMELYEYLKDNRPEEEYVLVHGDYCLPNVFFDKDEVSGYLDLGRCGIADKWQDIALAVRSLEHNLEEVGNCEEFHKLYHLFFNELGLEPDEEKIKYYILLDEFF